MKKIFQKICLLIVAAAMLFGLAACGETGFSFATDIIDGAEVSQAEYTFKASAAYGSETCELDVTCNGLLLAESEGHYSARLNKGENTIVLTAKSGNASEKRSYTVKYRNDLEIITDIDEAKVINDEFSFTASATFNDEKCALIATCNGTTIAETDGVYKVTLTKGNNVIALTARSGDESKTEKWTISYAGFTIVTDLTSQDTASAQLSFRANAVYGDKVCSLSVSVNGELLETQSGNTYVYTMPEGGEYEIVLTASEGGMTYSQAYTVRYSDEPPVFEELTLEDGKQLKGSVFTFSVIARDALGNKLDNSQLKFEVDLNANDDKEQFSELTSTDLHLVWSDDERTSYRLNLDEGIFENCKGAPFYIRATADAFGNTVSETYKMTYIGADADGAIGDVVFALEGFSISCGYFIEPQYVTVYEGEPFSVTLCEILEEQGWEYGYTGKPDSGFYLSSITGIDLTGNRVAESLEKIMRDRGIVFEALEKEYNGDAIRLGEFDYCQGSGWMYSVNGIYPNYGFSDYYPQDGDVVRVQFTLWYGSDIGGGSATGGGGADFLNEFADYAAIMKELAEIKANNFYGKESAVYNEVVDAITLWNVSQTEINTQLTKLRQAYGSNV